MVQVQTNCMRCNTQFWSKAVKNKLKEIVALRSFCRGCENEIRHDSQINNNYQNKKGYSYHPQIRSLEGVDEGSLLRLTFAQLEIERRKKEKMGKDAERQRQRAEI